MGVASLTNWHTDPPPTKSGIYDVTVLITRVPNKPFRMVALGYWSRGRWAVADTDLLDSETVIAWAERREPYAGPIEMTEKIRREVNV